ncbi:DEAD/DEAH box helicase [Jannaschia sp. 2305UL9-9]|uniref:DEAD/DEAH box helicase n=1 Tax=Jannaschia sp. 2305UL9-9 TaxID=3121638 RepID=UPI0035293874
MKKTLADALAARGYDTLTPVQEAVLAPELDGVDMLVSAQTGSGKTLGFGLAIAPTILGVADEFEQADAPLALIVAPTRELALQVKRELSWLYAGAGAVLASTVGGMDMRDERRALARGAHIVVSTPGRLRDHIQRGSIDLNSVRAVVLDEADEMLDLGFREDLEFILGECPEARQTLLFSATVPAAIAKLAQSYQQDAVRVATATKEKQHSDIEYQALNVSARDGENAIINVLRYHEAPNAIVFCNTRAMVNRLTTRLSNRGFPVVALSGELTQSERTNALQAMRDGRARVCVATDVAARGIDLPNLDLVIHAELPTGSDTLLHRSGRTGRAGRKGVSVMIVPPSARTKANRLLGWAKLSATWGNAPSADDVTAKDRERMLADPAWYEEVTEGESPIVNELAARFTPEQLAAAYIRLLAQKQTAPEDLSEVPAGGAKPAPRESFGASRWFEISAGRDQDLEPRRLLPILCKAGDVTRDDVGAIRIRDNASFVQIKESSADAFLSAAQGNIEGGLTLKPADGPPADDRGPRPGGFKGKPGGKPGYKPRDADDGPRPKKQWKPKPESLTASSDGAVTDRKPRHKADGGKPKFAGKPKGPKPPVGRPDSKKNVARAAAKSGGKPGGKPGSKPRG